MAQYLIGNIKGPKGDDGFSPKATVTQTSTGATITVEDADGITTANIRNGVDADGDPIDLTGYATKEELQDVEDKIPSLDGYATTAFVNEVVPSKLSELENDVDFVVGTNVVRSVNGMTGDVVIDIEGGGDPFVESDPTVPAWAKSPVKPTYGWTEIVDKPFDTLGEGLLVENGVLNATASGGSTYTAGDNIDITNDVISVPDLEFTEASSITGVDSKVRVTGTEIYAGLEAQGNEVGYFRINPEEGGLFSGSTFYNKGIDMKPNGFTFKDTANDKEITFAPTEDYKGFTINGDKIAVADDLASKQDVLTAGTGIDITGNVISATGGSGVSYTAGEGIVIENNVISTSEKPVRVIEYKDKVDDYTEDEKAYLINAYNDPFSYPCEIRVNTTLLKFLQCKYAGRLVGYRKIIFLGYEGAGNNANFMLNPRVVVFGWDSNFTTMVQSLTGGLDASGVISQLGANNPSGLNYQSVTKELKYVKDNFAKSSDLAAKQDALTAGTGITIENNVISASGGSSSINVDGVSIINDNGTYKTAIGGGTIVTPTVDYLTNASGTTTVAMNQSSNLTQTVNFSTGIPANTTFDVTYTLINHSDNDATTTITTNFETWNNSNGLHCNSGGLGTLGYWIGCFWMTGSDFPWEGISSVDFNGNFAAGDNVEVTGLTITANGITYLDNQTITFSNGIQPGSNSTVQLTSPINFSQTLVGPGYDDSDLVISLDGTVTIKDRSNSDAVVSSYSFTNEAYSIQAGQGAPVFYYDGGDLSQNDYSLESILCSVSSRDQETGSFSMSGIVGVRLNNGSTNPNYYAELSGLSFSLGGSQTQYINPDFLPLGDNLYVQDGRVHANGAPMYDGHLVIYDTNHQNGWYLTTDGNTITLNPCPWNN